MRKIAWQRLPSVRSIDSGWTLSHSDCLGQHTARGATKEKTNKLAELKARRKAKDERKKV